MMQQLHQPHFKHLHPEPECLYKLHYSISNTNMYIAASAFSNT